jgi:hypothetical protein
MRRSFHVERTASRTHGPDLKVELACEGAMCATDSEPTPITAINSVLSRSRLEKAGMLKRWRGGGGLPVRNLFMDCI